jgi:exonuclease SbcD
MFWPLNKDKGVKFMKFLHLSDLHIGKIVNGYSMVEEQRHALDQILEMVAKDRPDAVVIAGDVYDRSVPGVEAVCLFDDFLWRLSTTGAAVLLIAGNHDSPERLSYAGRLLEEKGIFLCGVFDGNVQKVVLTDEYGPVNFWLLPFLKPASVRGLAENEEIEDYDDAMAMVMSSVSLDDSARNVLVSHQFYTGGGSAPMRSESELQPVGGLDAVDVGRLMNFDYVALGHLHRAQSVAVDHIRYAGSPVKYSFSEWRHEKSVTLVEMKEKGMVSVSTRPIVPVHDMREIRGPLATLMSEDVSSLADREDYLRVVLTDEEEIIDPMGKLRSVYPHVMSMDFDNARTRLAPADISADIASVEMLSPYDLFCTFFQNVQGSAVSLEQAQILKDLLEMEGDQ